MSESTNEIRYPHVTVKLTEHDGNAYFVIGRVLLALREAGASAADLKEFSDDATSGDYDHLLQTVMRWVEVS